MLIIRKDYRNVDLYILFPSFSVFTLPNAGLTRSHGTYNPNDHGSDARRESNRLWIKHYTDTQWRASLNVSENIRTTARGNTRQKHKGYTPSPRLEIKISDPPEIEPGPPG